MGAFLKGAAAMNNDIQQKRRIGCLGFSLFIPVLAGLIALQLLVVTFVSQGQLAALIDVYKAPPYASYPYLSDLRVSLSSSQGMLYESTIPNSYVLRMHDGIAMQKVPERLFAAYNGTLYTSTFTSDLQGGATTVQALRESDGRLLWSYTMENAQSPQLVDGILYLNKSALNNEKGLVVALDALSGRVLWQYHCPATPTLQCDMPVPQVANGIAYTSMRMYSGGIFSTLLTALRPSDGAILWQIRAQVTQLQTFQQPLLVQDRVISWTASDTLSALRAQDGHLLWQIHPSYSAGLGTAANARIFLLQSDSSVYALNIDTGALLWHWQGTARAANDVTLTPMTVYIEKSPGNDTSPDGPSLIVLSAADGKELWHHEFRQATSKQGYYRDFTLLGEYNGIVYIQPGKFSSGDRGSNTLFAFRVNDGRLIWQRQVQEPVTSVGFNPPGGYNRSVTTGVPALLAGNTIYFVYHQLVSNVGGVHMTLSVSSALNSLFNTTTFTLTTLAIDAQTGNVRWQKSQVETYRVA
jgi:outer membrane protein assembly factor BamB